MQEVWMCVCICVRLCMCVWVCVCVRGGGGGRGGVQALVQQDHRKPQKIRGRGGRCGWAEHGAACLVISQLTSPSLSTFWMTTFRDECEPEKTWFLQITSGKLASYFFQWTNRRPAPASAGVKLGSRKCCVIKVPGCALSQQLIPFLCF